MLPNGNMRPLDNKEIFVTNDYIFYVSTMRPLQICRKRFFTICLLVAGCKGIRKTHKSQHNSSLNRRDEHTKLNFSS